MLDNSTATQTVTQAAQNLGTYSEHFWAQIGIGVFTLLFIATMFFLGYTSARPGKTTRAILHRALQQYEGRERDRLDPLIHSRVKRLMWKYDAEPEDPEGE